MDQNEFVHPGAGPRHSILDLAPLELECMSVLWPLGESTVRDIHRQLAESRPRAYTTIMTIMDRLAHKGIVTRRRVGRAYRYQATLSADEARVSAIDKIVAGFFDGSPEALAAHLAASGGAASRAGGPKPAQPVSPASAATLVSNQIPRDPSEHPALRVRIPVDTADTPVEESVIRQLDESLL
jgi:predicted transcriptional regulator